MSLKKKSVQDHDKAIRHHNTVVANQCFQAWMNYWARRRQKKQEKGISFTFSNNSETLRRKLYNLLYPHITNVLRGILCPSVCPCVHPDVSVFVSVSEKNTSNFVSHTTLTGLLQSY